jgi:hypothetical protein
MLLLKRKKREIGSNKRCKSVRQSHDEKEISARPQKWRWRKWLTCAVGSHSSKHAMAWEKHRQTHIEVFVVGDRTYEGQDKEENGNLINKQN